MILSIGEGGPISDAYHKIGIDGLEILGLSRVWKHLLWNLKRLSNIVGFDTQPKSFRNSVAGEPRFGYSRICDLGRPVGGKFARIISFFDGTRNFTELQKEFWLPKSPDGGGSSGIPHLVADGNVSAIIVECERTLYREIFERHPRALRQLQFFSGGIGGGSQWFDLKSGNQRLDESEKREEQSCHQSSSPDISFVTEKDYEFLNLSKQFSNAGGELSEFG